MTQWIVPSASPLATWTVVPNLTLFLPVLFSALIVLLGLVVAKQIVGLLRRSVSQAVSAPSVKDSPLSALWETTEGLRGTGVLSTIVFWAILLIFISWAGEILGISFFAQIVSGVLFFVPKIFSALILLLLGVMLAGVGERIAKQQIKRIAPQQAVLLGTFTSYGIVILFGLMALSELGIASNFILLLFAGCVFSLALAAGLAFGFGAKDLVADSLANMVQDERLRRKQVRPESSEKKPASKKE